MRTPPRTTLLPYTTLFRSRVAVRPCSSVAHSRSVSSPRASSRHREARKPIRSEEHTSELQSQSNLVCRLLLEKKKKQVSSYHRRRITGIRDADYAHAHSQL